MTFRILRTPTGPPFSRLGGTRGTFYIASGTCGRKDAHWRVIDAGQVRALHDSGHEIGCHTFSHACVEKLDARGMQEECRQNRERLQELCPGISSRRTSAIHMAVHRCRASYSFRKASIAVAAFTKASDARRRRSRHAQGDRALRSDADARKAQRVLLKS